MTYAATLLSDGERITMRSRQHPLAIIVEARKAILMVIAALVLFWLGGILDPTGIVGTVRQVLGWVTLVLFLVGLAWIALIVANWFNQEYIVTNRRVLKVEGLINKHAADSSLEKINDAVLDQNLFGRLLHYGDLDIITANDTEVDKYKMLDHVIEFKREILNQKHDLTEGPRPPLSPPLRSTPFAPPVSAPAVGEWGAGASGGSIGPTGVSAVGVGGSIGASATAPARMMTAAEVTAALGSLADLRDRGAITQEEFEAKKADLLGRL